MYHRPLPSDRPSPLRARRLLRGWRLRDVERATGIADTIVSRLERGDRPLVGTWLRRLADLYQTPADALVREHDRWLQRPMPNASVSEGDAS